MGGIVPGQQQPLTVTGGEVVKLFPCWLYTAEEGTRNGGTVMNLVLHPWPPMEIKD